MSRPAAALPPQHGAERAADLCVLGGGLVLGLAASVVLLAVALAAADRRILVGTAIYAGALVAMFGCSLGYRAAIDMRRRHFLRRLDHAAIFALIAGTATPFALMRPGFAGNALAGALWAIAMIGIFIKLYRPIGSVGRSVGAYLLLGWASLVALGPAASHDTVALVATGGGFYSLGILFLLWRRLPYRLAIWHAFVLAGAGCHYLAILTGVVGA
ncbi:MAG TPA: hemolysin III family protein [Stellaceae bacterium]|nr:hemolysin III family protein [Stellaceae bacterium]